MVKAGTREFKISRKANRFITSLPLEQSKAIKTALGKLMRNETEGLDPDRERHEPAWNRTRGQGREIRGRDSGPTQEDSEKSIMIRPNGLISVIALFERDNSHSRSSCTTEGQNPSEGHPDFFSL